MVQSKFLWQLILLILLSSLSSIKTLSADDDTQDDWLHVNDKAEIVDKNGKQVWLTGLNWFGYNVGSGVFDGVYAENLHDMLTGIADRGFNIIRVPFSVEILLQWKNGEPDKEKPHVNGGTNPEIFGKTSFEVWTQALAWCKELGIKIMIDIHSAETDSMGHMIALWYHGKYTTEDWYEALEWVADYYKKDDTILAIDLKNEPHGKRWKGQDCAKWDDSTDKDNWKYAAETAATKVLAKNPNLLILVEGNEVYPKEDVDWNTIDEDTQSRPPYYYGAWWGANLRGVKDYPIDLGKYQKQLVYSPHDYGPKVYEQSWFKKDFTEQTIMDEYWHDTWFFVLEQKIAPLLIGEWGGIMDGGKNEKWMKILRDLMIQNKIHHTFWCFNANSGDTGGLVTAKWTEWEEDKYALVKPSLWTSGGKFVSLDHKIPLGKNGISLGDL